MFIPAALTQEPLQHPCESSFYHNHVHAAPPPTPVMNGAAAWSQWCHRWRSGLGPVGTIQQALSDSLRPLPQGDARMVQRTHHGLCRHAASHAGMLRRYVPVPKVAKEDRLLFMPLPVPGLYRCVARYGYDTSQQYFKLAALCREFGWDGWVPLC